MKYLLVLNLMILSISADVKRIHPISIKYVNLSKAVVATISEIYGKPSSSVNLLTADNYEDLDVKDFKDELLKECLNGLDLVFRQDTSSRVATIRGHRKRLSVIIINNFQQFLAIYTKITPEVFRYYGKFLIVLTNGTIQETEKMNQLMWKIQIYNVNIIFEAKTFEIHIETFFPFNPQSCNDTTPVLIDRFINGKFQNRTENLYRNKVRNLHGCPIRISISNNTEPLVIVKHLSNGSHRLGGRDINLINVLSKVLNFKINYTFIGDEGYIFENGSAEGPLRALLHDEADLSISDWWLKESRLKFFDSSESYSNDHIIFIIPPGREFTTFEKLIYPFSLSLWFMIFICFAIGLLFVFWVKLQPKQNQNFVFGVGVKSPSFNIYRGFVGAPQTPLPKTNFARFLLMIFLIYSLIIRTAYQGSFYELLKSNRHYWEVRSLSDMVERDFKFYLLPWLFLESFKASVNLEHRIVEINRKDFEFYTEKIRNDPYFKGAVQQSSIRAYYFNQVNPKSMRYTICKEVFMQVPNAVYTKKQFFLLNELNEGIKRLLASGLLKLWENQYINERFLNSKEYNQPKILTLKHLIGCFQILIGGYVIGFVVFLFEVLLFKLKREMLAGCF